jgi:hypothetical protein
MHLLDQLADSMSGLAVPSTVAAFVFRALSAVVARRPGNPPEGVRIASGPHWVDLREGEFRLSFLSLFRLSVGLLLLRFFVVALDAIANSGYQAFSEADNVVKGVRAVGGLLPFASLLLVPLLWILGRVLSVRKVFVDGQRRQITVRWGVLVPFTTQLRPLADFTTVTVYRQKGGVFMPTVFRIRLERIPLDQSRKPSEVNPRGEYDHQQAYTLAKQIGNVADMPVWDIS